MAARPTTRLISPSALTRLGQALVGRRALVLGDLMLDEYLWGQVRRVSPEAPVPVVELQGRSYALGGAANVAANIAALGAEVRLGGVVGTDVSGAILQRLLAERGIDATAVAVEPGRRTTTKTRVLAHQQHVLRLDDEEYLSVEPALERRLAGWLADNLGEVEVCVLSDYGKGLATRSLVQQYITLARRERRPLVVDPKGVDYRHYAGATVVTPNSLEASAVTGTPLNGEASLLRTGATLVGHLEGSALLITRGAEGMTLFESGQKPIHLPARSRHVFDVTGAGDTVVSVLALALAANAPLVLSACLANLAAGIVVGKVGTSVVDLAELIAEVSAGDVYTVAELEASDQEPQR